MDQQEEWAELHDLMGGVSSVGNTKANKVHVHVIQYRNRELFVVGKISFYMYNVCIHVVYDEHAHMLYESKRTIRRN